MVGILVYANNFNPPLGCYRVKYSEVGSTQPPSHCLYCCHVSLARFLFSYMVFVFLGAPDQDPLHPVHDSHLGCTVHGALRSGVVFVMGGRDAHLTPHSFCYRAHGRADFILGSWIRGQLVPP